MRRDAHAPGTLARVSAVVTVGARAFLDSSRTDEEFLGVCLELFAELVDGRRIGVDPAAYRIDGPRRGAGALWGRISVDPLTLPGLDRELFADDPLEAATQALEASFSLRAEHLEELVRSELCGGAAARSQPNDDDDLTSSSINGESDTPGRTSSSRSETLTLSRRPPHFATRPSGWSSTRPYSPIWSADTPPSAATTRHSFRLL
jgi:hypothetical protein